VTEEEGRAIHARLAAPEVDPPERNPLSLGQQAEAAASPRVPRYEIDTSPAVAGYADREAGS